MITNTGKNILSKYLVGQTQSYAAYIAIGCGAKPLATDGTFDDYSEKTALDFEMTRTPIISRGYVNEDGVAKIVFTAALPTTDRYEITEVGVFSGESNPSAGSHDSRTIYGFSQNEGWERHTATTASEIPTVYEPLDGDNNDNIIIGQYTIGGTVTTTPVFHTNADNRIFSNSNRESRYERCRFLNNMVMIAGNESTMSLTDGHLEVDSGNHIHLTGISTNFSKNLPNDELRLAFSLINKNGDSTDIPDNVKILVKFSSSDVLEDAESQWAKFEVDIDDIAYSGTASQSEDFANERYFVVSKKLQDIYKSSGFTWDAITVVNIYVSIEKDGSPSGDYYIALDALRLENLSDINPLYGMTGYTVIKSTDAKTIVKDANTTSFVEFRFGVDIL